MTLSIALKALLRNRETLQLPARFRRLLTDVNRDDLLANVAQLATDGQSRLVIDTLIVRA